MTREAKIGMLTGLGVILLVGVLLSTYLQPNPPSRTVNPYDVTYRNQVVRPLSVPDATANAGYRGDQTPPPAYAVRDNGAVTTPDMNGPGSGQPLVAPPVTPVADGRVLGDARSPGDGLPTFKLADGSGPAATVADAGPTKPAPVTGKEYVIVQGDTLAKIAAKFYKTANATNEQRIVAANPAVLKNVKSMLTIGKKLVIPDVPTTDAGKKADGDVRVAKGPAVVIYPPGVSGPTVSDHKASDPRLVTVKPDAAKAAAPKNTVYVVKSGDTLGLIAARYLGTGDKTEAAKMVAKIVSLNKIKDPGSLQVGMKLKLPAKA